MVDSLAGVSSHCACSRSSATRGSRADEGVRPTFPMATDYALVTLPSAITFHGLMPL